MPEPHVPVERMGQLGVVTVTFNSADVIGGFMDSLLQQTYKGFRLYVVDNASADQTLQRLDQYRDARIFVVRNSVNLGAAEGNNIGIRAALADGCTSVLLINNDTEFDSGLLAELAAGLERQQSDMVAPKIFYFDEPARIWSAGGYFSRLRGSSKHFGIDRLDAARFDVPRVVHYSPTTCLLIKKEVFERIGLLDPRYFAYFEDTDFCYRAYQAGVKLFYLPSARLLHKVSSLTGLHSDFNARYCIRNYVYYILKNFPARRIVLLPVYQLYLVMKLAIPIHRRRGFWFAEKAFWEGVALFRSRTQADGEALE